MGTASSGSKSSRGHGGGAANPTTPPATTAAGRNLVAGNPSPVISTASNAQEKPGRDTEIAPRAGTSEQKPPQQSSQIKMSSSTLSRASEKSLEQTQAEQHSNRTSGKPSGASQLAPSTKIPQSTEPLDSALIPPPIPSKQRPSQVTQSTQNAPGEAQGKGNTPQSTPTLQTTANNIQSTSNPQTAIKDAQSTTTPHTATPNTQSTTTPKTVTNNTQSAPTCQENPKTTPPNQAPTAPTPAPDNRQSPPQPAADDVSLNNHLQKLLTVVNTVITANQLMDQRLTRLENFTHEQIAAVGATTITQKRAETLKKEEEEEEERLRVLVEQIVRQAEAKLVRRVEKVERGVEKVERGVAGVRDAVCRSVSGLLQGLTAVDGDGEGVVVESGVVEPGPGKSLPGEGGASGIGGPQGQNADDGAYGDGRVDQGPDHRESDEQKPDDQAAADTPKPKDNPHAINGADFPSSQVRLRSDDDDGEPKDGSVETLFGELEKKITNFVTKHVCYDVNEEAARDLAGGRWASRFPYAVWRRDNAPKAQWFRARVADLIYLELFAKPVFNCDDEAVENGLAAFEQLMAPGGRLPADPKQRQDLAHWRALTTRMLDRPPPPQPGQAGKPSKLSLRLATQLFDAFAPVLMDDGKDLDKRVAQLCNKAVECALVVRRSKATYLWLQQQEPGGGQGGQQQHRELARGAGELGEEANGFVGNGTEGSKFAFTVFGEVVKDQAEVEEDGRRFTVCASLRPPRVEVV